MRLDNKVAVVTGAASGIGKEIAIVFAREGAKVAIADLDLKAAEATANAVARAAACDPEQVMVSSTGVIGLPLKVQKILRAVPSLAKDAERSRRDVLAGFRTCSPDTGPA